MILRHKVALVAAGVGLIPVAVAAPAAHHHPGPAPALRATKGTSSPAPAGAEPGTGPPSPAAPAATIPPSSPTSTTAPTSTTEASTTSTSIEPTTVAAAARTVPDRPASAGGTTSASWYGAESGAHTANGDRYDPEGLTFAHRSMPFGTAVRFCRGGACVVATCTDRGPFVSGRDFDLSRAAFAAIAPLSAGVATVTWERLG